MKISRRSKRLRRAVIAFFRSERQEASLRQALDDAGAPFRDSPEAAAHVKRAIARLERFVEEAVPNADDKKRRFLAEFLMISMGSVAEKITERGATRAQIDAWATATAEMYCVYLSAENASFAK